MEQGNLATCIRILNKPLLPALFEKGVVTLFVSAKIGLGKTSQFMMRLSVQFMSYCKLEEVVILSNELYEIYGGKVMDLLNGKKTGNSKRCKLKD